MTDVAAIKGDLVLVEETRSVTRLHGPTHSQKGYVFGRVNSTNVSGRVTSWENLRTGSVTRSVPAKCWIVGKKVVDVDAMRKVIREMNIYGFEVFEEARAFSKRFKKA